MHRGISDTAAAPLRATCARGVDVNPYPLTEELVQPHREAIVAFLVGALKGAVDPVAIKQAGGLLERLKASAADEATVQAAAELANQLSTRGTVDAAGVKAATELLDRLSAKPRASGERVSMPGLREAATLVEWACVPSRSAPAARRSASLARISCDPQLGTMSLTGLAG